MTKLPKPRKGPMGFDSKWPLLVTMGFLLLLAASALYFNLAGNLGVTQLAGGSDPHIPLAELAGRELHFFDLPIDATITTRFVVQRSEDDIIHVAFASCPLCYASGRPSRVWWGHLICGHCNHRMQLPKPDEPPPEKKGCVPIAIPYAIEGDALIIRQQAVAELQAKWYAPKRRP